MRIACFASAVFTAALATSTAVSPACQCILFDGFGHEQNGTFLSPNFPVPYETDIGCLLYTFVGGDGELVELRFDSFQLQPREKNGKCLDYVRLYTQLPDAAVNEDNVFQVELCGNEASRSRSFYSKGRALIMQFKSDSLASPWDNGFIGKFNFLHSSKFTGEFQTDGEASSGHDCTFTIRSSDARTSGRLFSPAWPYHYPSNTMCRYILQAREGERVAVTFKDIQLPSREASCLNVDTYITVYEPKTRGHGVFENEQATVLARFCSKSLYDEEVISSGRSVVVAFVSADNGDGRVRLVKPLVVAGSSAHSGTGLSRRLPLHRPLHAATARLSAAALSSGDPRVESWSVGCFRLLPLETPPT